MKNYCQGIVRQDIIIGKTIMTAIVIIPARYDSTRFPGKATLPP